MLSDRFKLAARRVQRRVVTAGRGRQCPCCGLHLRRFLDTVQVKEDACPRCEARTRHRCHFVYLRDRLDVFERSQRVLHIAPEPAIGRRIRAVSGPGYVRLDLAAAAVDVRGDVTRLPFRSRAFDTIICTHVLEHVPDDRAAMRELRRVLASNGTAVLQVPFDRARGVTFEDPTVRTPAEKLRVFGHDDHVRIYGTDYPDRLRDAGFEVTVDRFIPELAPDVKRRYGLRDEEMFIARR